MKKNRFCLYYIIFLMICLVGVVPGAMAIGEAQEMAIRDHCTAIKDDLKKVQKSDARTRVYLGGKYETILNKYVVPLNLRMVENNLPTTGLIESQNKIASAKTKFTDDYVSYQQKLEELVSMDCKAEPKEFYEKLEKVRQKRKTVEQDVEKLNGMLAEYMNQVSELKERLSKNAK